MTKPTFLGENETDSELNGILGSCFDDAYLDPLDVGNPDALVGVAIVGDVEADAVDGTEITPSLSPYTLTRSSSRLRG